MKIEDGPFIFMDEKLLLKAFRDCTKGYSLLEIKEEKKEVHINYCGTQVAYVDRTIFDYFKHKENYIKGI